MSTATRDNVAKLYVATFNRAPDAAGLNYWVNSGMSIEDISQSFFDQTETQTLYPAGTTTTAFVTSVYQNLFNRAPDQAGLDYWVNELNTHSVSNQNFILAVMNGAQNSAAGQDSTILENKKTVGLSFADAGLNDVTLAHTVMAHVDETSASLNVADTIPYATVSIASATATTITGTLSKELLSSGKMMTDFGSTSDYPKASIIQPDGKIVIAVAAGGNIGIARYNTDGTLDTTFGTNGVTVANFSPAEFTESIVMKQDGSFVLGIGWGSKLIGYTPNGVLDTSFGTNGIVTTSMQIQSLVIDSNNNILAGGTTEDNDMGLQRYDEYGVLDTSFGMKSYDFGMGSNNHTVLVDTDGVVLVGYRGNDFALVRYVYNVVGTPDGTLDTSFGTNGVVVTQTAINAGAGVAANSPGQAVFDANGNIVVASADGYDFLTARYSANGTLDSTFGNGGIVRTDISGFGFVSERAEALAIQPDGKIVVAGYVNNNDFVLIRYNTDGSVDTLFGTDGIVETDVGQYTNDHAYCVTIDSNSKIVVGGGAGNDAGLVRYNSDGSLDTSFGAIGAESVKVYDGSTLLGIASVTGTNWSLTTSLANGSHNLSAVVENNNGNDGQLSSVYSISIDTTASVNVAITTLGVHDAGSLLI